MIRALRAALAAVLLLPALLLVAVEPAGADGAVVNTPRQRVSGQAARSDAHQSSPDVGGGRIVWSDDRVDAGSFGFGAIYSKDLTTRQETQIPTSEDGASDLQLSGNRLIWTSYSSTDQIDIYTKVLPDGATTRVTNTPAIESELSIDGSVIAWVESFADPAVWVKDLSGAINTGNAFRVGPVDDQAYSPVVVGSRVAWLHSSEVRPTGISVQDGTGAPVTVQTFESFEYVSGLAGSGSTLAWMVDPACGEPGCTTDPPPQVRKCTLAGGGCSAPQSVMNVPSDYSGYSEADLSGNLYVFDTHNFTTGVSDALLVDLSGSGPATKLSDPATDASEVAIDGTIAAWTERVTGRTDIVYRDTATSNPARPANSVSLGYPVDHYTPEASTSSATSYVSSTVTGGPVAMTNGRTTYSGAIVATDLTGQRREFPLGEQTEDYFYYGSSARMSGSKAVWPDEICTADGFNETCEYNIETDDAAAPSPTDATVNTSTTQSSTNFNGHDIDGDSVAWRCDGSSDTTYVPTACLRVGAAAVVQRALPVSAGHSASGGLRLSGSNVVWTEDNPFTTGQASLKVHVLDMATGVDSVVGESAGAQSFVSDAFEVQGSTVVWAVETRVPLGGTPTTYRYDLSMYKNTLGGNPGTASVVVPTRQDRTLNSLDFDGATVVWGECLGAPTYRCGVQAIAPDGTNLRDLTFENSDADPSNDIDASEVAVDGDRVFWSGHSDDTFSSQIFARSLTGTTSVQPDATPPGAVNTLTVTPGNGGRAISFTAPNADDLFGVRVLRRAGNVAPTGPNDPGAMVVLEGPAAPNSTVNFTDDAAADHAYSYAVYAYDEEPNYSVAAISCPTGGCVAPAAGGVSGTVTRSSNSTPVASAPASLCPSSGGVCDSTQTNSAGQYSFVGIGVGNYVLTVRSPEGESLVTKTVGPFAVSGADVPINVSLETTQSLPSGTSVGSSTFGTQTSGVPRTVIGQPTTLTTSGCAGGTATFTVTYANGGTTTNGTLTEGPAGKYSGSFAPGSVGQGTVAISIACPSGPVQTVNFNIYIDPSGFIRDTTGAGIADATVTLLRSETSDGTFSPVPDGSDVMSPSNRKNPDRTEPNGHFGWDVIPGFYKVRAQKAGCVNPDNPDLTTVDSIVYEIPPEVTDALLILDCDANGAFHPIVPTRYLDTRSSAPVGNGLTRDLQITGRTDVASELRVPEGATGVVMNVTVTQPTETGWITVFPKGQQLPTASNLNFTPGLTVPNLVKVKLGDGGMASFFNSHGSSHLIADVVGWFGGPESTPGARLTALPPARYLDSRDPNLGFSGVIGADQSKELQVTGRTDVPIASQVPFNATAVVMNVTITAPTEESYMTVFPAGQARPTASNLNYTRSQNVPNLVTVKLGSNGKVGLYNNAGSTHVIADVVGYYGPENGQTGARFTPTPPARLLDSRPGSGVEGGFTGAIPEATDRSLQITGRPFEGGAIPVNADAVVLNITVTQPTAEGYLTVYPAGQARPLASNLNFVQGQSVPNLVVVKIGADGRINLYNWFGSTQVIADVVGYYGAAGS